MTSELIHEALRGTLGTTLRRCLLIGSYWARDRRFLPAILQNHLADLR